VRCKHIDGEQLVEKSTFVLGSCEQLTSSYMTCLLTLTRTGQSQLDSLVVIQVLYRFYYYENGTSTTNGFF
jgi:hypothetical protein